MSGLHIDLRTGAEAVAFLDDLARLRIAVFRDFPYLYEGDPDYERRYLDTYARAPDSLFVLALDAGRVIGAATGVPMAQEDAAIADPWRHAGHDVDRVFYFGESVLLPEYRGRGLGHRFFDAREAHARRLGGFERTAFCAVDRAADHPRRPPGYRPLHGFWRARGYRPHDDLGCHIDWREVGGDGEVAHRLTFWSRRLD